MEHDIPLEKRNFSYFADTFRLAVFPRNEKDIVPDTACSVDDLYDFMGRLLDRFSMFSPKAEEDAWNTIDRCIALDDTSSLSYMRASGKNSEGQAYKGYWIQSFDGRFGGHNELWGIFFQPETKQILLQNNTTDDKLYVRILDNIDFGNRKTAQADLLAGILYSDYWLLPEYFRRMKNFGLQAENRKNGQPEAKIILGL